jgi:hypothetical protein
VFNEEQIEDHIINTINVLNIKRMPSASEIRNLKGNNILHNTIVRSGGYEYWANKLKLEIKNSDTKFGREYEDFSKIILIEKGYEVERMTVKHPFDLLINNRIKIDVKVGNPYYQPSGSRVHKYGLGKKYGSCDFYLIIALNETQEIEKTLIIPSYKVKRKDITIGRKSKYDIYKDRWDLLKEFDNLLNSFEQII